MSDRVLNDSDPDVAVAVTEWRPSAVPAGIVTSRGTDACTGEALPCGRSVTVVLAGVTVHPEGAAGRTTTWSGARPVACTSTWTFTCVALPVAGITTGNAGSVVADNDRVGGTVGTAAIKALSALACVRQSKTFGSAPDHRSPSRSDASRSLLQTVAACCATKSV